MPDRCLVADRSISSGPVTAKTTWTLIAVLGLLPALLTQCASLDRAVTIGETDKVRIRLVQAASEKMPRPITQTLCTENLVDRDQFYNARNTDQLTKVVPAETMQILLDAFATAGYFDNAAERLTVMGSSELHVEINGKPLAWARTPLLNPDQRAGFVQCWAAFLDTYNRTTAYRTSAEGNDVLEEHRQQRANRRGSRR